MDPNATLDEILKSLAEMDVHSGPDRNYLVTQLRSLANWVAREGAVPFPPEVSYIDQMNPRCGITIRRKEW